MIVMSRKEKTSFTLDTVIKNSISLLSLTLPLLSSPKSPQEKKKMKELSLTVCKWVCTFKLHP